MKGRDKSNIKGLDISAWQNNINFARVKKEGVKVVIIKATEGVNFVDKRLNEHYVGASKEGLKIGFYHFMSDKTSPKEQARDFWSAIKNKKFHIIPVLDIERETIGRGKTEVTNRCLEFLKEFKALSGYDCIVYTYTFFAKSKLDSRLKSYPLWIAHYGVNTPGNNGIWKDWVGFQYTDKGKIKGITGYCDLNEFTEGIFIKKSNSSSSNSNSSSSKKELWQLSISGQIVSDLQMELNKQFKANLKVDGYFGSNTLKKCINVSLGAKGNITKIIQKRLVALGYKLNIDGIFGDKTEKAIKELQKKNKLKIDGIVGKNTCKVLFKK